MKLGIFGRPLGHSHSPKLFSILARLIKMKISYEAVEVSVGGLPAATAWARAREWRGASVTIPFKIEAAKAASRLTPAARAVGAVNALRFEGEKIVGHNTDAQGLRDALKHARVAAGGRDALIFGAGGAARAAGYALGKNGARTVRFTARTSLTAKKCARDLAPYFPKTSFSSGAPRNADIWINATPLGMQGCPDVSPAPRTLRAPVAAVDLVYGRKRLFSGMRKGLGRGYRTARPCLSFRRCVLLNSGTAPSARRGAARWRKN